MQSHNPVLTRTGVLADPSVETLEQMYGTSRRMTVDDVVGRTAALLAVLFVTAATAWALELYALALPAALIGFGLALVGTFKREPMPALYVAYAAVEGVFLGAISRVFDEAYPGIAVQAIGGTMLCFGGVLAAYKSGKLRNTPRFTKVITSAIIGIMGLYLVNIVGMLAFDSSLPVINESTPLGILFSVAVVTVAALSFVLDFDLIEKAEAHGAPEKFAWKAAFGLVVGLVWLYLEMLRLLSKLRD